MLIADKRATRALCLPGLEADCPANEQGTGVDGKPLHPWELLNRIPEELLLGFEFDTDAHLLPFDVHYKGETLAVSYRIRKEALAPLAKLGVEVLCSTVFIDVDLQDLPGMARGTAWADLTDSNRAEVLAGLLAAAEPLEWSWFYTTAHGARFAHRLTDPVPAGANFERLAARVRARYDGVGIPSDPKCSDWTRLYRAPRVTREDGAKTWEQPWFEAREREECWLVPEAADLVQDLIEQASSATVGRSVGMDDAEAEALVWAAAGSRSVPTDLTEVARKIERNTRGHRFYAAVFGGTCLATEGRHNTLVSLVGYLCGEVRLAGGTAEHAYALAREATKTMSEDGHDWRAEAAEMVRSFWSRDDAEIPPPESPSTGIYTGAPTATTEEPPADEPEPAAPLVSVSVAEQDAEFQRLANEALDRGDSGPHKTFLNVKRAIAKLGARVWYDEFDEEKRIQWGGPACRLGDRHEETLWTRLGCAPLNLHVGFDTFKKWLNVAAFENCRHPLRDYIGELKWDGTPRVERWLTEYFGCADSEYTRAVGRLFLVAAVRRVMKPGCTYQEMLLLESDQGDGKSGAIKALCPNGEWFSDSLVLGVQGREVLEQTLGKWIVEAGELVGLSPGRVQELKAFLSRDTDEGRLSYGRNVTRRPRQFVIVGTTNGTEYLIDYTGGRRFWPVKCGEKTIVRRAKDRITVDRDQLWAEAKHLEANPEESIRLDERLYPVAAVEQEKRRIEDPFEDALAAHFSGIDGPCKISVSDLWTLLGYDVRSRQHKDVSRLGAAMTRLRFVKKQAEFRDGRNCKAFVRGDGTEQLTVKRGVGQTPAKLLREGKK